MFTLGIGLGAENTKVKITEAMLASTELQLQGTFLSINLPLSLEDRKGHHPYFHILDDKANSHWGILPGYEGDGLDPT